MSKAEERALEAYPKDIEEYIDVNGLRSIVDDNGWQRAIFLKGYHQAEEDLKIVQEELMEKVCRFLDGYAFIPTYVINELKKAMENE